MPAKVRHVELIVVCHAYDARHRTSSAHIEIRDNDAPSRKFAGIRALGDAFVFAYGFKTELEAEARTLLQKIEVTISVSGRAWDNPHYRKGISTASQYGKTGKGYLISGS